MQATGFWIILKDPRVKDEGVKGIVDLLPETEARIAQEDLDKSIETNVLEVLSVGPERADKRVNIGNMVAVDPRQPALILPIGDETYLIVADSQVIAIVE